MKKFIPHITFALLTSFTALNQLSVLAGGCSTHFNKTAKIECDKKDMECLSEKVEKFDLKKTVKS